MHYKDILFIEAINVSIKTCITSLVAAVTLEELRRVLASSSYFWNYSPYFVSMASSLPIYNASKNQLKWLGTLEDLSDLLSSQLGIDSKDFQVQDN